MSIVNIPNALTFLRIILMFPTLYALVHANYLCALILFIVAAASDMVDGLLARRYGWITRLGSIIDPIADKCLLLAILATLAYLQFFPWWLFLIICLRDIYIACGALAYHCLIGQVIFAPLFISKVNTFLQLLLVSVILLELAWQPLPVYLFEILFACVMLTTGLSLLHYTWIWGLKALKRGGEV